MVYENSKAEVMDAPNSFLIENCPKCKKPMELQNNGELVCEDCNQTHDNKTIRSKVRFFGDDIIFQFSRESNGSQSRMATITNIHEATPEELEQIVRIFHDKKGQKNRCSHRRFAWTDDKTTTLVGESSFRFKGESPRRVKVYCTMSKQFLDNPIFERACWQSFDAIFDEEVEA
jgi:uncharacterized Zn finger protein (UPF0148 family)